MTAKILMLTILTLLLPALAACGQGYTTPTGPGGSSYDGAYQGGPAVPAVMPEDRERARGN